jgi:hypothetical protein
MEELKNLKIKHNTYLRDIQKVEKDIEELLQQKKQNQDEYEDFKQSAEKSHLQKKQEEKVFLENMVEIQTQLDNLSFEFEKDLDGQSFSLQDLPLMFDIVKKIYELHQISEDIKLALLNNKSDQSMLELRKHTTANEIQTTLSRVDNEIENKERTRERFQQSLLKIKDKIAYLQVKLDREKKQKQIVQQTKKDKKTSKEIANPKNKLEEDKYYRLLEKYLQALKELDDSTY